MLRDWSLGNFTRYTTPPATSPQSSTAAAAELRNLEDNITQLYANDEAILSIVQTRKERRKQGGLVRFASGSIDPRKVAVEEPWNILEQNSDEEGSDDEDEHEIDNEDMNVDEEHEESEEEASDPEIEDSQEAEDDAEIVDEDDDESEVELPPSRDQKRKRGPERSMPLPPAKKTALTAIPPKIDRSTKRPMKTAQQKIKKPLKSVQDSGAIKSLSKPNSAATVIPVHRTPEKKGKIANATVKRAKGDLALAGKSRNKGEPEAYDFGKFF